LGHPDGAIRADCGKLIDLGIACAECPCRIEKSGGVAGALLATVLANTLRAAPQTPILNRTPDSRFAVLEHAYVLYSMSRFPVMATYLGGSAFDPALSDVDGTLRDYSPAGIAAEDQHLRELRTQFVQSEPRRLSARRRIDRIVALAQIDFLLHQHDVQRHQQNALDSSRTNRCAGWTGRFRA